MLTSCAPAAVLLVLLGGCGSTPADSGPPPGPRGGSGDAGSTDGGGADGGGAHGGTTDGGTSDGGATANFEVSVTLASDVDPDAPTTIGIVTWQLAGTDLEDATLDSAEIRFGLDDSYGMVAPIDVSDPDHRTLLLGMKPESTYHFQIQATLDGQTVAGDDLTLQTGAAPPLHHVDLTRSQGSEPGFIVMTEFALPQAARQGWVYIVDPDGDVVWWYRSHFLTRDGNQDSANAARMSWDGQSMWMLSYAEGEHTIERVSMDTLDHELFAEPHASHDLVALSGGDCIAYIAYTKRAGKIRKVCAGDEEVRTLSDISAQGGTADHLNALRYKADEDLLLVSDHLYDVYAVDRTSGDVQWKLSELTADDWGGRQHGAELTDDTVLIFANQGGGEEDSIAVEYSRSTGDELFRYDAGLFSHQLGDVQRLPGGNTLVSYSAIGIKHEVTPEGEVVMVLDGPNTGYGWWRASLYGPPPQ